MDFSLIRKNFVQHETQSGSNEEERKKLIDYSIAQFSSVSYAEAVSKNKKDLVGAAITGASRARHQASSSSSSNEQPKSTASATNFRQWIERERVVKPTPCPGHSDSIKANLRSRLESPMIERLASMMAGLCPKVRTVEAWTAASPTGKPAAHVCHEYAAMWLTEKLSNVATITVCEVPVGSKFDLLLKVADELVSVEVKPRVDSPSENAVSASVVFGYTHKLQPTLVADTYVRINENSPSAVNSTARGVVLRAIASAVSSLYDGYRDELGRTTNPMNVADQLANPRSIGTQIMLSSSKAIQEAMSARSWAEHSIRDPKKRLNIRKDHLSMMAVQATMSPISNNEILAAIGRSNNIKVPDLKTNVAALLETVDCYDQLAIPVMAVSASSVKVKGKLQQKIEKLPETLYLDVSRFAKNNYPWMKSNEEKPFFALDKNRNGGIIYSGCNAIIESLLSPAFVCKSEIIQSRVSVCCALIILISDIVAAGLSSIPGLRLDNTPRRGKPHEMIPFYIQAVASRMPCHRKPKLIKVGDFTALGMMKPNAPNFDIRDALMTSPPMPPEPGFYVDIGAEQSFHNNGVEEFSTETSRKNFEVLYPTAGGHERVTGDQPEYQNFVIDAMMPLHLSGLEDINYSKPRLMPQQQSVRGRSTGMNTHLNISDLTRSNGPNRLKVSLVKSGQDIIALCPPTEKCSGSLEQVVTKSIIGSVLSCLRNVSGRIRKPESYRGATDIRNLIGAARQAGRNEPVCPIPTWSVVGPRLNEEAVDAVHAGILPNDLSIELAFKNGQLTELFSNKKTEGSKPTRWASATGESYSWFHAEYVRRYGSESMEMSKRRAMHNLVFARSMIMMEITAEKQKGAALYTLGQNWIIVRLPHPGRLTTKGGTVMDPKRRYIMIVDPSMEHEDSRRYAPHGFRRIHFAMADNTVSRFYYSVVDLDQYEIDSWACAPDKNHFCTTEMMIRANTVLPGAPGESGVLKPSVGADIILSTMMYQSRFGQFYSDILNYAARFNRKESNLLDSMVDTYYNWNKLPHASLLIVTASSLKDCVNLDAQTIELFMRVKVLSGSNKPMNPLSLRMLTGDEYMKRFYNSLSKANNGVIRPGTVELDPAWFDNSLVNVNADLEDESSPGNNDN